MTINTLSLKTLLIYWVDGYNIKTGVIEILKYLRDFINVFDILLIKKVINYKGFEYIIKTINLLLYSLLYNLSEL
jgi:hypothetical protein